MSLPDSFSDRRVQIECADMAKMNKIRAWARKNGATVKAARYARDAYEGVVVIPSPWNEGAAVADSKVAALRALLGVRA